MSYYDLGGWQAFLPEQVWKSYMNAGDLNYKLLNDRYFVRMWDVTGLFFSLGSAFLFYFTYTFLIETVKTINIQAAP